MTFNSTIRQRVGYCSFCNDGKKKPLVGDACHVHYWLAVRLKSVQKQSNKEVDVSENLQDLISECDTLVSKYVRLSRSDKDGMCKCFTCSDKRRWQELDAGHFIGRANMFLRFDYARNIRPQCVPCNRLKYGNILIFGKRLEEEHSGIIEILMDESKTIYKYTREELKQLSIDLNNKISFFK